MQSAPSAQDAAQINGEQAYLLYPDLFAEKASNGAWKAYAWLQYVSERITPKIVAGGGRFIIEAPPQHGKSEFISNWVPTWFLNRFPTRRVILASYAQEYAQKWGAKVRENLSENPVARVKMRRDTKSKRRFMTQAGGQMITAGIGGPITGEGADLFIVDDPVKNYADAMSEVKRETNLDWYRSVARTRLSEKATIIVMHTRWHEEDLAGQLQAEGGWEVIRLPALSEDIKENPNAAPDLLDRPPGAALCPQRYTAEFLKTTRTEVGEIVWSALFQQNPISMKGNVVEGAWIKTYDELPEKLDETAIFADLTYKDKEENDFAVFELWGRLGANIYLIAQIRDRMGFPAQLEAFQRMVNLYPDAFHREIEEKANGAALIQVAKDVIPGLCANNPKTDKLARLASVAPLYKSGNVWYPNPQKQPWVKVNISEITKFPKAKHDDTVDVASMAVAYLGRISSTIARLEALSRR